MVARTHWSRPAWLSGIRGFDVSLALKWFPVVTFWQVAADMVNAKSVPDGHGHNYDAQILNGWVSVVAPDGWTPADTSRLQQAVAELPRR